MDWFRSVRLLIAAGIGICVSFSGAALAQDEEPDLRTQLRDFVFFVNIHQAEAATGTANAIFARGLTPRELLEAVEEHNLETEVDEALGKALRRDELEPIAARMLKMLNDGRLQRARDPNEIQRNIEGLTGGLRQRLYARDRLKYAGEYAMPQLIEALMQRSDVQLRTQVERLLNESGRASVIPLAVSLQEVDPTAQEQFVNILGRLGYSAAAPYIAELRATTNSDPVRAACDRALDAIGASGTPADLYVDLAEGYYDEREELTAFPGEEMQLLWTYDPAVGLNPTAIRTEVFHEARAMDIAEKAMELESTDSEALSLWVASNFSRQIDEPAGYDNPAYPPTMREAMYYAVASGPETGEDVLERALEDNDTRLARLAVESIERTAGPELIWDRPSGQSPLVDALTFPNRRVQYDAALAIAASHPRNAFRGAERVVPTLASSIRFANESYAMIIAGDEEQYQPLRRIAEAQGYTVLPFARRINELQQAINDAPAVDLVITQTASGQTERLIDAIRSDPKLGAAPIFALVASNELPRLRRLHGSDATIDVRSFGINEDQLTSAISELVETAADGRVDQSEANSYALRSLEALRDLAIAENTVLNVADATTTLVAAMNETTGEVRLQVAEVLSRIERPSAQNTLAEAALAASGDERVALLGSLAGSAKRFGNQLNRGLVQQIIDLTETGEDEVATAAATVVGALGVSQDEMVRLIMAGQ